ncbi:MAG: copper resistance protein B [Tsuneonella sp.]|jgi:copper resistance protein B
MIGSLLLAGTGFVSAMGLAPTGQAMTPKDAQTDVAQTASACTSEHAAMGHCQMPDAKVPASAPTNDPDCPPEHAKMGHCTPKDTAPADDAVGTDLAPGSVAGPAPVAANYADRVWGRDAMQPTREDLRRHHGGGTFSKVTIDLAELTIAKGHEGYRFETDAWFGGDINRLALKAEGEGTFGEAIEGVDLKALYSRAIGPYFNLQGGLRQEIGHGPDRTHAVIGIEGLAPYWFEVDAYLSLSTQGELRASASAEYDKRLTQRLILQPKIEFDLSAQDIPALGIGSGLSSGEVGVRLRYEIAREFAPYVGIVHERTFGRTASFARASGDDTHATSLVLGVRAWF